MLIQCRKHLIDRGFNPAKGYFQISMPAVGQPYEKVCMAIALSHHSPTFSCCKQHVGKRHIQPLQTPTGQVLAEFQTVYMSEVCNWGFQQRVNLTDQPFIVLVIIALKEICQRSGAFSFPHCLVKSLSFTLLSATTAQFPVKKNIEKAFLLYACFPLQKYKTFAIPKNTQ